MLTIILPEICSHINLLQFFAEKNILHGEWEKLTIHIPNKCFLYSSAIAFLCSWGINCRESGRIIQFTGDVDTRQYLSRIDFFKYLDISFERQFKRHPEQGRFMPLHPITDDDSVFEATNAVCDLVLHQFDNARTFLPAMEWAVNEVVDNIQMHAQTPIPGIVCAQYYHKMHRLDIGIYDMGRGIKASLSESMALNDHEKAITKALQRGITRNRNEGMGNGLAGSLAISRRNKAEFHLWSGDTNFNLSPDQTESFVKLPIAWGTGILFRLNTENPVALEDTFIADDSDTWSYLNAESDRIKESGGIHIQSNCRHTGSREAARPLRRKILNLLPDYDGVLVLDFENIQNASSSFLDELLGKLVRTLGTDTFTKKIQLANISSTLIKMTNVIIHGRITVMEEQETTLESRIEITMPSDDEIILHLIASGVVQLAQQTASGQAPKLPYPIPLQRGLDRFVAVCLRRDVPPPQGAPGLLAWCHQPLHSWPLELPVGAIGINDTLLQDNRPTEVCEEWAYDERDIEAEIGEQSIMSAVLTKCRNINAPESYQAFRRLLIESPVLTQFEFQKHNLNPILRPLSEYLTAAYQPAPTVHSRNGYFYCCPICNNLLWRTVDDVLICENKLCYPSEKEPQQRIPQDQGVLWVTRGIRRFVSVPGIFELRLESRLKGLLGDDNVEMWPAFDQYDLRLTFFDGEVWALDAKNWANPFLLAKDVQLNPIPSTPPWQKAFYVFPNERRQQRPDYVRAFETYYNPKQYQIEAIFERDLLTAVKRKLGEQS